MKLKFKVALPKENYLPLLKEVLSKGGFMKPAPELVIFILTLHFFIRNNQCVIKVKSQPITDIRPTD